MFEAYLPNFSWKVFDELPVDKVAILFPRNSKDSSKFYVVQVTPKNGLDWTGNFRGIDNKYLSGVFSWPDPNRLCVVAGGKAYVVQVDAPDVYEELPILPIINVYYVREQGVILFATFSNISAFGKTGLMWKAKNLAKDGIVISDVRNGIVYGVSKRYEGDLAFKVDLKTGQQYG
jgi:hypothetical protein